MVAINLQKTTNEFIPSLDTTTFSQYSRLIAVKHSYARKQGIEFKLLS